MERFIQVDQCGEQLWQVKLDNEYELLIYLGLRIEFLTFSPTKLGFMVLVGFGNLVKRVYKSLSLKKIIYYSIKKLS